MSFFWRKPKPEPRRDSIIAVRREDGTLWFPPQTITIDFKRGSVTRTDYPAEDYR